MHPRYALSMIEIDFLESVYQPLLMDFLICMTLVVAGVFLNIPKTFSPFLSIYIGHTFPQHRRNRIAVMVTLYTRKDEVQRMNNHIL